MLGKCYNKNGVKKTPGNKTLQSLRVRVRIGLGSGDFFREDFFLEPIKISKTNKLNFTGIFYKLLDLF